MPSTASVTLTHGLWQDGCRHVQARLRPLTGRDEADHLDGDGLPPAVRATTLLAASVRSIGAIAPVTPELVRDLTIGDRERLLLALYAATFGAEVETLVSCADPRCGERIEAPVDLRSLVEVRSAVPAEQEFERTVSSPSGPLSVRFRALNGADHEAVAQLASADLARASDQLLLRCILSLSDRFGSPVAAETLCDVLRAPMEEALKQFDAAAETSAALTCPSCGLDFTAVLDGFAILDVALKRSGSIFADVNRLARAYHWSEADMLALPLPRRRQYLALLEPADRLQ